MNGIVTMVLPNGQLIKAPAIFWICAIVTYLGPEAQAKISSIITEMNIHAQNVPSIGGPSEPIPDIPGKPDLRIVSNGNG